jgi:hypothetical protein
MWCCCTPAQDVGQLHTELQQARVALRRSEDDVARLLLQLDTVRRELEAAVRVWSPCASV